MRLLGGLSGRLPSPRRASIEECTMLVKGFLEDLGCKARLVSTGGNPVVYGEYDVGADLTVLVYTRHGLTAQFGGSSKPLLR